MDTVVARIKAHHEAGADHVCVQVITEDPRTLATSQWSALAKALL
jgi:2-methylisocitrate lyase-like PEP mutase family enzyme